MNLVISDEYSMLPFYLKISLSEKRLGLRLKLRLKLRLGLRLRLRLRLKLRLSFLFFQIKLVLSDKTVTSIILGWWCTIGNLYNREEMWQR
jgi:hypothetical protein